jgi:alkaline phosphatase
MNRRKFLSNGSLLALGTTALGSINVSASNVNEELFGKNKKAKNIIFLVSDGMSQGTLSMADLFLSRKTGKGSVWMQLYKEGKLVRALMDTASASSIVTDSAAGSSSWGSGFRVNNGSLNVGVKGENYLPILQKFKKKGKKVGCVTTVPITHATPAGFCINSESRKSQADIAEMYANNDFDFMMGGGLEYFNADIRKDKKDIFSLFEKKGYQVVKNAAEMEKAGTQKPVLGVFYRDGLPYYMDRNSDDDLKKAIPSLAEMTQKAIEHMKDNPKGFVMQVESGKVDWAAHANDAGALIHEQIQFDEAIKVAMDFAEKDKETLVIITTDHGNANPGIIYGSNADKGFDSIQKYTKSNEWILNAIHNDFTPKQVRELIETANGLVLSEENAKTILSYYSGQKKEEGLYNYKNVPFQALSEMQKKSNSVGFISNEHSGDLVELAVYGPGSHLLKPFVKNTDLHYLMLQAAQVENVF